MCIRDSYDPDWNVGMYKAMGVPWNTKDESAEPSEILNFGEKTDYRCLLYTSRCV